MSYIASSLGTSPATTATAIVTGADAELTNIFLQQVAIAAYRLKATPQPAQQSNNGVGDVGSPRMVSSPSWLTSIRISFSTDGVNFVDEVFNTGLNNADEIQQIRFPNGPRQAKVFRIYPLKYSGPAPSLRVQIYALQDTKLAIGMNSSQLQKEKKSLALVVGTEQVVGVLTSLKQAISSLIMALEYLSRIDELRKAKKQDEVRKVSSTRHCYHIPLYAFSFF